MILLNATWGVPEIILIALAAIIVVVVLILQIKSFKETRTKIYELISFFPNECFMLLA